MERLLIACHSRFFFPTAGTGSQTVSREVTFHYEFLGVHYSVR
jgi:hypothetical protein